MRGVKVQIGSAVRDRALRRYLRRIVEGITRDRALREDLLEEALVHLWLVETRRPGQTRSWYLHTCKYHLRHYLASGRSVDSPKRGCWRLPVGLEAPSNSDESVVSSVSAHDLISVLSEHLSPAEKAVLDCCANGLGTREIGRRLNVSHTMVIKRRRKIAALLRRLERRNLGVGQCR